MSDQPPAEHLKAQGRALIRDAVAHDIPVLGHCLGGQLISRALGGEVTRVAFAEAGE